MRTVTMGLMMTKDVILDVDQGLETNSFAFEIEMIQIERRYVPNAEI